MSLERSLRARDRGEARLHHQEQFRGWILKWTNYIKGYQKRWFVLSNGLLSYFRTQEEMAHTCRGTINLAGASIDTVDSTHFVITNGPSQVFHLRALDEVERQRWVTALELAKARAIKNLEEQSDEEHSDQESDERPLALVSDKLTEVMTTHDLIRQKHQELLRLVSLSESDKKPSDMLSKLKEKTAMFKIAADAMARSSEDFAKICHSTERRWKKTLQNERKMRQELQENFEALAKQMHGLENQARRATKKGMGAITQDQREIEDSHQFSSNSLISLESGSPSRSTGAVSAGGSGDVAAQSSEFLGIPVPSVGNSASSSSTIVTVEASSLQKLPGSVQRVVFDTPDSASRSVLASGSAGSFGDLGNEGDDEEDEDKFFDAPEGSPESVSNKLMITASKKHTRTPSSASVNEAQLAMWSKNDLKAEKNLPTITVGNKTCFHVTPSPSLFLPALPTIKNRRTAIPPRPNVRLNLWSIMRNCIGKELTKIPMPVHFSEPLSMLQRMSEEMAYSHLLDSAAACEDSLEQAAYIAAFACSAYSTTAYRSTKPFNPMLGETFECDRRAEYGWRCLLEQVSHHPPALAMVAENKEWCLWQEYTLASKFRGKYLQCFPIGCVHLVFHRSGHHYTWSKVVVTVHNIIVGKLWVDNAGDMSVVNHTTSEKCSVKYHAYSYFSRERQRKVTGMVYDAFEQPKLVVSGYWDDYFECAPVLTQEGRNVITGPAKKLWQVEPLPAGSELMYHFSPFTCSLNEMEDGIAPTDARFRPDQRVMEEGDFDEANRIKVLLEEKQRARRRKREALQAEAADLAAAGSHEEAARLEKEATYYPAWFKKEYDPISNTMMYVYKGGYWEAKLRKDWADLPNVFET